jgi:hypothetical protein
MPCVTNDAAGKPAREGGTMPIRLKNDRLRRLLRGCTSDIWLAVLVLGGIALSGWLVYCVRRRWALAWVPSACLMSALLPLILIAINWLVRRFVDIGED